MPTSTEEQRRRHKSIHSPIDRGSQGRRSSPGFNEFFGKRWPCNAEEEPETLDYPKGQ